MFNLAYTPEVATVNPHVVRLGGDGPSAGAGAGERPKEVGAAVLLDSDSVECWVESMELLIAR